MKKIFVLTGFLAAWVAGSAIAQCTSNAGAYDLIVTNNVTLAPAGPQFIFGYVCTGGTLVDSTNCCTRLIHVETGGTYEAGPAAYGYVYLKSGAAFDAHGNNNFFMVDYEAGALILNYAGPQNLCTAVIFPAASCVTGITENKAETVIRVYPNPTTGFLTVDAPAGFENETITIYDMTGKQARKPEPLKYLFQNTLDVNSLLPGMYSYIISENNGFAARGKFIVTR